MIPSYQQVLHLTRPGLVLEQCVQRSLTAPCQMLVVTPPPPQLPHGRHLPPIRGEDRGHVTVASTNHNSPRAAAARALLPPGHGLLVPEAGHQRPQLPGLVQTQQPGLVLVEKLINI